jgi:hypothetical protein
MSNKNKVEEIISMGLDLNDSTNKLILTYEESLKAINLELDELKGKYLALKGSKITYTDSGQSEIDLVKWRRVELLQKRLCHKEFISKLQGLFS